MSKRFERLAERDRPVVNFSIDGRAAQALQGDTLLVAILTAARKVRTSEFGDGNRAGFCLMGACQDCWVWTAQGDRLRSCTTPVTDGLEIITQEPEAVWPRLA